MLRHQPRYFTKLPTERLGNRASPSSVCRRLRKLKYERGLFSFNTSRRLQISGWVCSMALNTVVPLRGLPITKHRFAPWAFLPCDFFRRRAAGAVSAFIVARGGAVFVTWPS